MPIVDEMFNKIDEMDYKVVLIFNKNRSFCEMKNIVSGCVYKSFWQFLLVF